MGWSRGIHGDKSQAGVEMGGGCYFCEAETQGERRGVKRGGK